MLPENIRSGLIQAIKNNNQTEEHATRGVNLYLSHALLNIGEKFSHALDNLNALDGIESENIIDDATAMSMALSKLKVSKMSPIIVMNTVIEDLEEHDMVLMFDIEERHIHDLTDTRDEAIRLLEAQQDLINHVKNICLSAQDLIEEYAVDKVPAFVTA